MPCTDRGFMLTSKCKTKKETSETLNFCMREETITNNPLLSVNIIGGALITNFIDKCKTETKCFR